MRNLATHPLGVSAALHIAILGSTLLLIALPQKSPQKKELVRFDVIEKPKQLEMARPKSIQTQKIQGETPPTFQKRVFGISRKAVRSGAEDAPVAKLGNTIAKEVDDKVLEEDDPDSVSDPVAEYLVTEMPILKDAAKIPYPEEAKTKSIEGVVYVDIVIDQKGVVREASLFKGPGYGLNEAALQYIYDFKFQPGKVGDTAVVTKIRYAVRFVLED